MEFNTSTKILSPISSLKSMDFIVPTLSSLHTNSDYFLLKLSPVRATSRVCRVLWTFITSKRTNQDF